eukprot:4530551-Pyramimonas_sp.AAC.1
MARSGFCSGALAMGALTTLLSKCSWTLVHRKTRPLAASFQRACMTSSRWSFAPWCGNALRR